MKTVLQMFFVILLFALVVGCGDKIAGIEGKVVDGKGQPMSGVKVIAKQVQPIKGYEQFETTTGSDGAFTFKGLFPASEYTISMLLDKGNTSAKVMVKSGPEGQTSIVPSPMTIRFSILNNDIIADSQLGLEWVPVLDQPMNWFQAQSYSQRSSLGGGGWRLPTRSELKSIYDKSLAGGIHPAFNIHGNWVWTSETQGGSAWSFDFGNVDPGHETPMECNFSGERSRTLVVRSKK